MIRKAKRKNLLGYSEEEIRRLCEELASATSYPLAFCELLISRNIFTKADAESFLHPTENDILSLDPFLLCDMEKAVDRIIEAVSRKELICIFGDYDVDGICATSMLIMYLRHLGAEVFPYIPSRHDDGYGMSVSQIENLKKNGVSLIVTVDNGITAVNETKAAKQMGIDVVITDHHRCFGAIPECVAVVCGTRQECVYPNKSLCGAGTVLKLISAIAIKRGESVSEVVDRFVPFAGLATVADVVPLTGENRAIVKLALDKINYGDCPVGIKALISVSRKKGTTDITERDFGFALAPRLNAAGRLTDAMHGVELLCSKSFDAAIKTAERLDSFNDERRIEEKIIFEDACNEVNKLVLSETGIIILKSERWNPGVIGIAAARLCQAYYRPVILLSDSGESVSGSCRSIPNIDIHELLCEFSDLFTRFGGHKYAAGLSMSKENFDEFCIKANAYVLNKYPPEVFIPQREYDAEIELSDVNKELIKMLSLLAPFGEKNPAPVFFTEKLSFAELRKIGTDATHLAGVVEDDIGNRSDFVAFDKATRFSELIACDSVGIFYTPSLDTWGKRERLQLKTTDFDLSNGIEIDKIIDCPNFYDAFLDNMMYNVANKNDEAVKTQCSYEIIRTDTDKAVFSALSETICETLVLCYTEKGAIELLTKLKEHDNMNYDICFCSVSQMPQKHNTVVIAPIDRLLCKCECYRSIIVYDTDAFSIFGRKPDINKLNSVTLPEKNKDGSDICDLSERLKKQLSREQMACLYKEILRSVNRQSRYFSEVVENVASVLKVEKTLVKLAIKIFSELGFLSIDKNLAVIIADSGKKTRLEASTIYSALMCAL